MNLYISQNITKCEENGAIQSKFDSEVTALRCR